VHFDRLRDRQTRHTDFRALRESSDGRNNAAREGANIEDRIQVDLARYVSVDSVRIGVRMLLREAFASLLGLRSRSFRLVYVLGKWPYNRLTG
jgi:hypothetical protein